MLIQLVLMIVRSVASLILLRLYQVNAAVVYLIPILMLMVLLIVMRPVSTIQIK